MDNYGYPVVEECPVFKIGMYLFLVLINEISTDMLEEHMLGVRDPYQEEKEDTIIADSREEHWRDVAGGNYDDRSKCC